MIEMRDESLAGPARLGRCDVTGRCLLWKCFSYM